MIPNKYFGNECSNFGTNFLARPYTLMACLRVRKFSYISFISVSHYTRRRFLEEISMFKSLQVASHKGQKEIA